MCIALAQDCRALDDCQLRDVCILVISYQYGVRPGGIARIGLADVKVHDTGAVHFAFLRTKQQTKGKRIRLLRRVKRDWCPLFVEFVRRRERANETPRIGVPARLLFGLKPGEVSLALSKLTEELTSTPWSARDMRHTSAQNEADSGQSRASITEFLGQVSQKVANVYYDNSPTQGERINEALAISPVYENVAKIAKTRTVTPKQLQLLKGENQVGASPHGIPMSGIGACELGQSLCLKSPALSCYTCSRFMPVNDPAVHQAGLDGLRPVVNQFAKADRGNTVSPAYSQLKATCNAMRATIDALRSEEEDDET